MKILAILFLSFTSILFPQELNCKVNVNLESIPIAARERLSNFSQVIEDYMNKTNFTGSDWQGGKIQCAMTIVILSVSNEVNYTAQAIVSSQRPIYKSTDNSLMLTINDNEWAFNYEEGQALYANQSTFDPLTSFLDFYANIIIGFDMDSWESLGGSPYFSNAFNIVNLGANSNFSNGWTKNSNSYSRRGLVEDLLNEKYRHFREAIYDYYYGIDIYAQNPEIGREKIVKLINVLEDLGTKSNLTGVFIKVFFDAKNGEIIEHLKEYPDKEIFVKLRRIDPAHTSKYNEILDSRN